MIESVKIENFRCFSELEVHGLMPVNIIVGENASGKSAFLEAIYISREGMPSSALQLREWRQMGSPRESGADASSLGQAWEDLFHNYDSTRPINIELKGDQQSSHSLQIFRDRGPSPALEANQQSTYAPSLSAIKFQWKPGNYDEIIVSSQTQDNPQEWLAVALRAPNPIEFLGPHIRSFPQWLASRFSDLSKEGETAPILDALRSEYPFLKDLSLELDAGNPSVFASIEGSKRKLPAALVSDGFNKLLGILLSIASASKGTLLIDQIEDGFYFKKLPSIWKVIHGFAKANNTQIFATTHSKECLDALLPVIEANENDFALLRATRADDSIRFSVSNGRRFASALSQEFELR